MARDVLMERRVAQAGTLQARSTAVDTEAWNARPTQRHKCEKYTVGRDTTGQQDVSRLGIDIVTLDRDRERRDSGVLLQISPSGAHESRSRRCAPLLPLAGSHTTLSYRQT